MKTKITMLLLLLLALSCSKKDDDTPVLVKSSEKQLVSIVFNAADNAALEANQTATVNEGSKTISASMPVGTDISALTPTINVSAKASVAPTGVQNFSSPVTYKVTAEDGTTANYSVKVMVSDSSENQLLRFVFREADNGIPDTIEAIIDAEKASLFLVTTSKTDLTALVPQLEVSEGASYAPQGIQDFSEPVIYTVTAPDGTKSEYTVDVKTERDLVLAIAEANPNHTLDWNLADADIENWDIELDDDGYIEELDLYEVNLSVMPDDIGYFKKLKELNLDENPFTELPESIGNLSNLIALDLEETNLKELPKSIGNLSNLRELDLRETGLTELPSEFVQLEALKDLDLSENQFEEFPEEVFQLTNLIELRYQKNQLKELPIAIASLKNLEKLYLSNNLLSNLPDEVQFMDGLKTIYLSENQFEEIPEVIFALDSLVTLYLSNNSIKEVSPNIAKLTSLVNFYINDNLLQKVPEKIATIASLNWLDVTGNPIEILPEELCVRDGVDLTIIKNTTTICED